MNVDRPSTSWVSVVFVATFVALAVLGGVVLKESSALTAAMRLGTHAQSALGDLGVSFALCACFALALVLPTRLLAGAVTLAAVAGIVAIQGPSHMERIARIGWKEPVGGYAYAPPNDVVLGHLGAMHMHVNDATYAAFADALDGLSDRVTAVMPGVMKAGQAVREMGPSAAVNPLKTLRVAAKAANVDVSEIEEALETGAEERGMVVEEKKH
jgi:hypothetical protein